MDLADYRRLFSVLEIAADAVGKEYFFDQIREALARNLQWTDTLIVDIPVNSEPFPAPSELLDHSHSDRPACFTLEYAERWHLANPFKTPQAQELLQTEGLTSVADLRAQRCSPQWAFVEQYLRRHGIAEVLNGLIDAGPGGKALSCVYVNIHVPQGRSLFCNCA